MTTGKASQMWLRPLLRGMRRRRLPLLFSSVLCLAMILPRGAALAGPIFPEQAAKDKKLHLRSAPVPVKAIPVFTDNPAKGYAETAQINLDDGLNALEAPVLAAVINPRARKMRSRKGLSIPQVMEAGLVSPPIVQESKLLRPWSEAWLPRNQTEALQKVSREIGGKKSPAPRVELETAWIEWQASQAARLYFYERLYSRKIIDTLREIRTAYREIYRTAEWPVYRGKYDDKRVKARAGYRHIGKYISDEKKVLSEARVQLDHALGLPTNLHVPVRDDMDFALPRRVPMAPQLIDGLGRRRIDLRAIQEGIVAKDPANMGYIYSRFEDIVTFVGDTKKAEWLNTKRRGVIIDLPLFSKVVEEAPLRASDGKKLFEEYKRRIGYAKKDIPRLRQGMDYLLEELTKVDLTLPAMEDESHEAGLGKDSVIGYEKLKAVLAVKLLRLRLMKKLIRTTIALELASGMKISRDIPKEEVKPFGVDEPGETAVKPKNQATTGPSVPAQVKAK